MAGQSTPIDSKTVEINYVIAHKQLLEANKDMIASHKKHMDALRQMYPTLEGVKKRIDELRGAIIEERREGKKSDPEYTNRITVLNQEVHSLNMLAREYKNVQAAAVQQSIAAEQASRRQAAAAEEARRAQEKQHQSIGELVKQGILWAAGAASLYYLWRKLRTSLLEITKDIYGQTDAYGNLTGSVKELSRSFIMLLSDYNNTLAVMEDLSWRINATSQNLLTLRGMAEGSAGAFDKLAASAIEFPRIAAAIAALPAVLGPWATPLGMLATYVDNLTGGTLGLGNAWSEAFDESVKFNKSIVDGVDKLEKYADLMDEMDDLIRDFNEAMRESAQALAETYAEIATYEADVMRDEFYQAQDDMIEAARYAEDLARQTARQLQDIVAQYQSAIANAVADKNTAIQSAQRAHTNNMIKIEEDYRRQLRDIMRKYDALEWQAIRDRDALALVEARRGRQDALEEARENYDAQKANAQRSYAEQVANAENAYQQQLDAAKRAYEQQLAELQRSLAEEEEDREISLRRQEEDRKRARERERGLRLQEIGQKLADIYLSNQAEQAAMQNHYNQLISQMRGYYESMQAYYTALNNLRGTVTPKSTGKSTGGYRQSGGYAGYGTYQLGERGTEFVLSANTTRAMEQLTGGMLTQQRLLSSVMSQRSVAAPLAQRTTVNHVVSGDISGQVEVAVNRSVAGMEARINAALSKTLGTLFRGIRI